MVGIVLCCNKLTVNTSEFDFMYLGPPQICNKLSEMNVLAQSLNQCNTWDAEEQHNYYSKNAWPLGIHTIPNLVGLVG